jgi:glyoxylase-like metal-dependent hydrolase (beta-lactamase superfamily II)
MKNTINRRTFLKLGVLTSTSFIAHRHPMGMNLIGQMESEINKEFYQFKVGDFECFCINDGGLDYKPEHFFKNVPKEQVEKILSERNLPIDSIYTPYTHLLVKTKKHLVLVDMGAGQALPNNGKLPQSMKSAGIEPRDIDTIIITHAHPDHIGGTLDDRGKPIYSNARYYIWKDEWEFWFSEAAYEKTNEFFVNVAREQLNPVQDRLTFLEKETEILSGINIIAAPGHTPGHIAVSFSSKSKQLYYIADTVLYPLHLEYPDWLPIYDITPERAEISKRKIFNLVADNNALVIGQHFVPFPSIGSVTRKENGWLWKPIDLKG